MSGVKLGGSSRPEEGNPQKIQWFPGHMARTEKQIAKDRKLADAVVEIVDARIPVSSRNPVLDRLIGQKPRVVLMNKADLADPAETVRWLFGFLRNSGAPQILIT